MLDKIEEKVKKWMEKHADELDENDIDQEGFKDLLVSILGGYA